MLVMNAYEITWLFIVYSLRSQLVGLGLNHKLRLDKRVKLLLGQGIELKSTLLESQALLVGVLGDLAGHIVANLGVEAGNQHETTYVSEIHF